MDQQFQDARGHGRRMVGAANELVAQVCEALWLAYQCHHLAADLLEDEHELMRAEYERVALSFVPGAADHTRVRLDQAIEPIEHALRAMVGDETFEAESDRRIADLAERARVRHAIADETNQVAGGAQ